MRRFLSLLLCVIITFGIALNVMAVDIDTTANYILKSITNPTVASIGGEWAVIGLARGGAENDAYFQRYLDNAKDYIKSKDGILHSRKYTEYSRVILAFTALGRDATNVFGYDLTAPLGDFDKTVSQGLNGAIFALLALDSGDYKRDVRSKYVNYILQKQLSDGGWALAGTVSDVDVTAMALQALAKYTGDVKVKSAIDKALVFLSKAQLSNGGFATYGEETAESAAQVIVALTELGIPLADSRFVKSGKTAMDAMLAFRLSNGGFKHLKSQISADGMATEQCFYALVAADRINQGKCSLYRMSDVQKETTIFEKYKSLYLGIAEDLQMLAAENSSTTLCDILYKLRDGLKNF